MLHNWKNGLYTLHAKLRDTVSDGENEEAVKTSTGWMKTASESDSE